MYVLVRYYFMVQNNDIRMLMIWYFLFILDNINLEDDDIVDLLLI